MTTSKEKPTVSYPDDQTVRYSHPAYATLSVSRPSISPGINLFGSDIDHQHAISVEIRTATLDRHLNSDWINPGRLIMDFTMSETQWAQFISGIGSSIGTPITLSTVTCQDKLQRIPQIEPIRDSRKEEFNREMVSGLQNKLSRFTEIIEELGEVANGSGTKSGTISKTKVRDLHQQLARQLQSLPSYFEFMAERFQETTEEIVNQARTEVEAHFNSSIQRLGIQAVAESLLSDSDQTRFSESPEVKLPEFLP